MNLFTVQIGSKLHGFATDESDDDLVTVYADPLRHILSLNGDTPKGKQKKEDGGDHTHYELRHFCKLLIKGNPTVFEVLNSNMVVNSTPFGDELRNNLSKFYDDHNIYSASCGYVYSTMKEADNEDYALTRRGKKCLASIRIIEQAESLFLYGGFSPQSHFPREVALKLKAGDPQTVQDAIASTWEVLDRFQETFCDRELRPILMPDRPWINDYLYRVYTETPH